MTAKKEIEALAEKAGLHPDSIGRSRKEPGTWILKRSFFYTHGYSAEKMADRLRQPTRGSLSSAPAPSGIPGRPSPTLK